MLSAETEGDLPLYCPECDHPTAANGTCFRCHPLDGASPAYEAHPCEYRTTCRHSPWCPWVARNTAADAPPDATVFNVKSAPYNAKGDGTTDDTEAIQAAFDAAAAVGGEEE